MNHTRHIVIAILALVLLDPTIPTLAILMMFWLAGWIAMAMRRPHGPWYCMACGTPEAKPVLPEEPA